MRGFLIKGKWMENGKQKETGEENKIVRGSCYYSFKESARQRETDTHTHTHTGWMESCVRWREGGGGIEKSLKWGRCRRFFLSPSLFFFYPASLAPARVTERVRHMNSSVLSLSLSLSHTVSLSLSAHTHTHTHTHSYKALGGSTFTRMKKWRPCLNRNTHSHRDKFHSHMCIFLTMNEA